MQLFLNNFSARLTAPLTSSSLTLQLAADDAALLAGLGTGDHYLLTLAAADSTGSETAREIVRATAVNGMSVTIERGQEGTLPAEWPINSRIELRLTAGWIAALTTSIAGKVDAQPGKVLSTNDFTTNEKTKLAGLESSHFKGMYADLAALQAAVLSPVAGDYADVDAGVGSEVVRHLWDSSDAAWRPQLGASAQLTATQIKAEYESNLDTNAFTDAEKAKLASIGGATVFSSAGSLTVTETHNGGYIEMTAAGTITVSNQASGGWSDGASLEAEQASAGTVGFAGAPGVTIRRRADLLAKIIGQYGVAKIKRLAANTWTLSGDLMIKPPDTGELLATAANQANNGFGMFGIPSLDDLTAAVPGAQTSGGLKSVAFNVTGTLMAVGTAGVFTSSPVLVFDTATWQQVTVTGATESVSEVCDVVFTPDGSRMVAALPAPAGLALYNTADWSIIPISSSSRNFTGKSAAISPDGSKVVLGSTTSPYLWSYSTADGGSGYPNFYAAMGGVFYQNALPGSANGVKYSNDGTKLAIAHTGAPYLTIYNIADWTKLAITPALPDNAFDLAYSPDGTKLAVGHATSPFLTVYDTATWAKLTLGSLPASTVRGVAWSRDGKYLAAGGGGTDNLAVYEVATWTKLERPTAPRTGFIFRVAFSPVIA